MASTEIWGIYPEVYHYTKFNDTLSILKSATLRATFLEKLQLDDSQEIIYAKNIIAKELLKIFDDATIEDATADLELFYKAMGADSYITSFCGKNDDMDRHHRENGLLNMWKSYGADTGGVRRQMNLYQELYLARDTIGL